MFKKIKNWFKIPAAIPPSEASFAEVNRYTIDELTNGIEYNTKIIQIARFSFWLWFALLIGYCLLKHSLNVFVDIKLYPAPLWAIITGAFSEQEKLENRKKLSEFIKKHVNDDENLLKQHVRDTTWDEYKNFDL